jgi:hypothetical protein
VLRKDALTGTLKIAPTNGTLTNEQALAIYETYNKAEEEYVKVIYVNEDVFNADKRTKYIFINGEY